MLFHVKDNLLRGSENSNVPSTSSWLAQHMLLFLPVSEGITPSNKTRLYGGVVHTWLPSALTEGNSCHFQMIHALIMDSHLYSDLHILDCVLPKIDQSKHYIWHPESEKKVKWKAKSTCNGQTEKTIFGAFQAMWFKHEVSVKTKMKDLAIGLLHCKNYSVKPTKFTPN